VTDQTPAAPARPLDREPPEGLRPGPLLAYLLAVAVADWVLRVHRRRPRPPAYFPRSVRTFQEISAMPPGEVRYFRAFNNLPQPARQDADVDRYELTVTVDGTARPPETFPIDAPEVVAGDLQVGQKVTYELAFLDATGNRSTGNPTFDEEVIDDSPPAPPASFGSLARAGQYAAGDPIPTDGGTAPAAPPTPPDDGGTAPAAPPPAGPGG
jgi:hypothetical protein